MRKHLVSAIPFLILIFSYSCKQEEIPVAGTVSFSFSTDAKSNGRTLEEPVPGFVLLSFKNPDGAIQKNVKLTVYQFGQGYVSDNLELQTGNYSLTEFFVLSKDNKIIYATPLKGSDLAIRVKNPLPIDFAVQSEGTQVTPQVISVSKNDSPISFGYTNFAFEVVPRESDDLGPGRIRFELYTDKDFSTDARPITFEAQIRKYYPPGSTPQLTTLWDSVLNTRPLKNIPSASNKIVFEKPMPEIGANNELSVGFKYTIEGVGISWYYVSIKPNEKQKTVSFNFK
jgi:hypothetical protein